MIKSNFRLFLIKLFYLFHNNYINTCSFCDRILDLMLKQAFLQEESLPQISFCLPYFSSYLFHFTSLHSSSLILTSDIVLWRTSSLSDSSLVPFIPHLCQFSSLFLPLLSLSPSSITFISFIFLIYIASLFSCPSFLLFFFFPFFLCLLFPCPYIPNLFAYAYFPYPCPLYSSFLILDSIIVTNFTTSAPPLACLTHLVLSI